MSMFMIYCHIDRSQYSFPAQVTGLGAALPAVFIRSEKNLAGRHQLDRHPGQTRHPGANVAVRMVGPAL